MGSRGRRSYTHFYGEIGHEVPGIYKEPHAKWTYELYGHSMGYTGDGYCELNSHRAKWGSGQDASNDVSYAS